MKAGAKHEDAARAARAEKLRRRFPTIAELRRRARWRVPRFAFDFVDGGANDEECARRNATALSAVELLPRYCIDTKDMSTEVELFGRHFDGAPASIDILPAVVAAVGSRATVMVDSGIRGGLDIVRALALGAKATFAGRPFLYGLGALGEEGARHVMDMFFDELRTEFQHVGVRSVAEAAMVTARHPGAWRYEGNQFVSP